VADDDFTIQTQGLAEVVVRLNRLDPGLRKEIQTQMKAEASPLIAAARSLLPAESPLENWYNWPRGLGPYTLSKARTGVKVTYKGSSKGPRIPLLTFQQTSAVGAIVDMAGRADGKGKGSEGGARGQAMIGRLDRATGRDASRTMYPALEAKMPSIMKGLQDAVDQTVRQFQREIYQLG